MRPPLRRIGVSTGGGDCPGLNAVLRAIVLRAEALDIEVVGIEDGLEGLLPNTARGTRVLRRDDVRDILARGGTILGTTNRNNPFAVHDNPDDDRSKEVVERIRELGLDVLIMIGGDGTQAISRALERRGIAVIGVPKTIDNDLPATYETFGFGTAVEIVTEALDRLHTTAESHERIMILEVMGRTAGWIALHAGIAGGAHAILIPEIPYDAERLANALRTRMQSATPFALVVVAEGARSIDAPGAHEPLPAQAHIESGAAEEALRRVLLHLPQAEARVTVLGHLQRGGTPIAADRLLATRLGIEAVEAAVRGEHGVLVSWRPPDILTVPLATISREPRIVDPLSQIVEHAKKLGICFGD